MFTYKTLFKKHVELCYKYKNCFTVGDNNKKYYFKNLKELGDDDPYNICEAFNIQDDTRVTGYNKSLRMGLFDIMAPISEYINPYLDIHIIKLTLTPLFCEHLKMSPTEFSIWIIKSGDGTERFCPSVDESLISLHDEYSIFEKEDKKFYLEDKIDYVKSKEKTRWGYKTEYYTKNSGILTEHTYVDNLYSSLIRMIKNDPLPDIDKDVSKKLWKPLNRPEQWNRNLGFRAYLPFILTIIYLSLFIAVIYAWETRKRDKIE